MNIVTLIGNVKGALELSMSGGVATAKFDLDVVTSKGTPGESTDTIEILTTGRQAELAQEYIRAGCRIAVDGRLQEWGKAAGKPYPQHRILARRIEFLAGHNTAEAA